MASSDGSYIICRNSLLGFKWLVRSISTSPCSVESTCLLRFMHHVGYGNKREYLLEKLLPQLSCGSTLVNAVSVKRSCMFNSSIIRGYAKGITNESIELKTDEDIIRFNIGNQSREGASSKKAKETAKKSNMSRKAKLNELRFYRLKAKKKMNSPNPEVRIRYKLEKVGKQSFGKVTFVLMVSWIPLVYSSDVFTFFHDSICVYMYRHINSPIYFFLLGKKKGSMVDRETEEI